MLNVTADPLQYNHFISHEICTVKTRYCF